METQIPTIEAQYTVKRVLSKTPLPVLVAAALGLSNGAGLAMRTSENPTIQELVKVGDCYDIFNGGGLVSHPLNSCYGDNPLLDNIREVRRKTGF